VRHLGKARSRFGMKEAPEGCIHATSHEKPGCADHDRRQWAGPNPGVYAYTKYTAISREPGCRVLGKVGKAHTPNANQERFFSTHRASIRNQHPQNTCKHQRDRSFFSMKPRVNKPQKNGRPRGWQDKNVPPHMRGRTPPWRSQKLQSKNTIKDKPDNFSDRLSFISF